MECDCEYELLERDREIEMLSDESETWRARAERAEGAIERVRAIHARRHHFGPVDPGFPPSTYAWHKDGEVCANCRDTWPCDTIAALDTGKETSDDG